MTFQTCLSQPHMTQNLHFYEPKNVLFINNAKSGCSTVKASLLQAIGASESLDMPDSLTPAMVHDRRQQGSFWSRAYYRIDPENTFTFSVVRNPYTRVLSAFLDKICRPNLLRTQFFRQHGLDPKRVLTFDAFLGLLDTGASIFDQHWRPQTGNLLAGYLNLHEIRYLENFSETAGQLAAAIDLNVRFVTRDDHGTNAAAKLKQYLTPAACQKIQEIYRDDFEVFGYSTDPEKAGEAPADKLSLPCSGDLGYSLLTIIAYRTLGETAALQDYLDRKQTLSFEEKALVYMLPGIGRIFSIKTFREEILLKAKSDNPGERFIAQSCIAGLPKSGFSPDLVEDALIGQVRIAPYLIFRHAQLIRYYIARGHREKAAGLINELADMTWQQDLIRDLRRELAP